MFVTSTVYYNIFAKARAFNGCA